ncbi:MAG: homocysteine S-methyltransferase family protein [Bacteroidota bacterium]
MTLQQLLSNTPVLFDGATGTEYQRRGLPIGAAPEIWVMENPDAVKDVHRTYVAAGAQVIETCTFGATKRRLEASDVPYSVADVTRTAVALAKEAAAGKALVAGSVGPFGGILEPYGEVSVGEVEELFAEQMSVLVESGADIVLIETMISLSEAIVALRTAKSVGASTVGVTMTFEMTGSEPRTSFGESVQDAVKALTEEGAAFIGANCGAGFELMRIVATSFRAQSKVPLLIQTNAGIPSIENGLIVYPEQAASFGRFAKVLADLGIDMIGGCCGTTPEHIAEAAKSIK